MKQLRCIAALLLCLTIFFVITPVKATAAEYDSAHKQTNVPAELKAYAEESTLPFIKGWLKSNGAIGRDFESPEEIDSLQVGAIFRPYYFKEGSDTGKITSLSDLLYTSNKWMMIACTPEGKAKWFAIIAETDEGNGYRFSSEGCAVGLGQALEVFETINRKNRLDVEPMVICYRSYEMIVMEVIDGQEYVITAGEKLDKSYMQITEPQYLPTGMDAVKAMREANADYTDGEEDEVIFGDAGLFWLTAAEQPSKPKLVLETWHILLIAGGVCVIAAVAVCLAVAGKRKVKN